MHNIEREEHHELLDPSRASTDFDQYEFKDKGAVSLSILTPGLKNGLKILAVVNGILLSAMIAIAIWLRRGISTEVACAASTSFYSPLLEPTSNVIEYETVKFDGGFLSENVYKGRPNKQLDQAWDRIANANLSVVGVDVIDRLGASRGAVKYSDENGGQYMALVEAVHQLHCLNMIRMYTWRDYYERPENRPLEFTDKASTMRLHVDHCIDMLRQVLMCQADVGIVPFYWVKGQGPSEDFSTTHKCRNFDKIIDWTDNHAGPGHEPVSYPDSLWLDELPSRS